MKYDWVPSPGTDYDLCPKCTRPIPRSVNVCIHSDCDARFLAMADDLAREMDNIVDCKIREINKKLSFIKKTLNEYDLRSDEDLLAAYGQVEQVRRSLIHFRNTLNDQFSRISRELDGNGFYWP